MTELELFKQWFPLARAQGLVIASRQEGDEILVLTTDEVWIPFQTALNVMPFTEKYVQQGGIER